MPGHELRFAEPQYGFQDPARDGVDRPEEARAVVVPFGLEASVSYGAGTARGPAAILAASQQLELFDEELWREPYRDFGIATLEACDIVPGVAPALDQLAEIVDAVVARGAFPLVLGGEHALTPGAVRPLATRHPDLVVLQIDAHADLRDGYLGEHFSHASAMRRVLDLPGCSIVGLGIRAICEEEARFIEAAGERVSLFWAHEQEAWDLEALHSRLAGQSIYLTFDVDGLDSTEMPATGTPMPGGLTYHRALDIVRLTADAGTIVAADVVELSPIDGLHAYDFTAAAIANKILNYALSGTARR